MKNKGRKGARGPSRRGIGRQFFGHYDIPRRRVRVLVT